MNIKDFLIDNYIWILVIILITIITIIGFLADKKKGNKTGQNVPPVNPNLNNQPTNNGIPMQYQQLEQVPQNQMNNNMGMNNNIIQQAPLNQNMVVPNNLNVPNMVNTSNVGNINSAASVVTEPQPIQMVSANVIPVNNNPQPVENVVPNIEQESMYQPLSEQKPVIAPQPIPSFGTQNQSNQVVPQPIVDNTNVQVASVPQIDLSVGNMGSMMPNSGINQASSYNVGASMPMDNNSFGNVSNSLPNNMTIPQPVNPIPVPQPVTPQPIMQQQYNSQPEMQPNYGQPIQSVGQTMPEQQMSQPINFVYGPQNNNQGM